MSLLKTQTDIDNVIRAYEKTVEALKLYYCEDNPKFDQIFIGFTPSDILEEYNENLIEVQAGGEVSLLAAIEALFRIDYLLRVDKKCKDGLSRDFREVKKKRPNPRFEDDILALWREHYPQYNQEISDIKAAFKYRHWLAHGRYWVPKLGQQYNFETIAQLANSIHKKLPFRSN